MGKVQLNSWLYVDTALFNDDDLSVVFSFTRNHFMVDAPLPYQYAHFLKTLMPREAFRFPPMK